MQYYSLHSPVLRCTLPVCAVYYALPCCMCWICVGNCGISEIVWDCGILVFGSLGICGIVVLSSASGSSEIWVSRNILAREAVGPAPWPPVVFAGLVGSSQKYLLVGGQGGIEPVVLLALNA
jgi:hypothetical protein